MRRLWQTCLLFVIVTLISSVSQAEEPAAGARVLAHSALYNNASIPIEIRLTGNDGISKKFIIGARKSLTLAQVKAIEICTHGHGCQVTEIDHGVGYQIVGDIKAKIWYIAGNHLEHNHLIPGLTRAGADF